MMNQKSRKEGCESYASERRVASRDESYEKHYPQSEGHSSNMKDSPSLRQ